MQVILLQRVEKLGKLGEVVTVRPGYARNFLLPKKIALRATQTNMAHFEKEREALEKVNLKHKDEAEKLATKLEGTEVVIIRQASEAGQLYGSVTARDIADALKQAHVTKNNIQIHHPIKTIGIHAVKAYLHPEVSVYINVNVAMSEEEAKAQVKAAAAAEAAAIAEREAEALKPKKAKEVKESAVEVLVEDAAEEAILAEGEIEE